MAKIGQYSVYVQDAQGETHCFLPGDEVPAWAAKLMGPHCFATGDESAAGQDDDVDDDQPDDHDDDVADDQPGDDQADDQDAPDDDESGPPPRSGRGSGESEWRKYAERHGLDTTEIEGRDALIAACDANGIPVE